MAYLRSSVRLVCALWPIKVDVMQYANLCLEVDDRVEDAYRLLQLAEIDNDEPVMISCVQKLNSQQSQINEAKVARHRVPSINYAVGLVMIHLHRDAQGLIHQMQCVILSWDECFREEVSRRKWGLSFEPVAFGFCLDQPFYHIIPYYRHSGLLYQAEVENNLYVPQESLLLHPSGIYHDYWDVQHIDYGLGIYFELFDGRRYVPNDEHKAHFPDDDAAALSLIQEIYGVEYLLIDE
ncbi:hypothetical protein DAPPUDRAFT_335772 [Daphnia pulex]|uniref:Hemimethylated DNA-binding domain-containing protein n=1 Tax=Daphnia pulex TaxID=6669 RepID=E9HYF9_DAPPU|nr:hypothetical protein DAPPUDRAFT_335772 [Daphnia pulex]|eukprot:EFX63222.1 hypothetical protein DAPPUDRAFT_335772 [Daphnia pulex]